ncbi:MAG: hypothetical protein FJ257_11385 [Phycisphaerae bacterium]|nr:hypothetical protein [Phycisphaerae bacterium]
MNQLSDRQQAMLDRGLSEFRRATRVRRARLTAAAVASMVVVLAAIGVVFSRSAWRTSSSELPEYVEIIQSDLQLVGELQLARACEQIERTDGRIRVQECVALAPTP